MATDAVSTSGPFSKLAMLDPIDEYSVLHQLLFAMVGIEGTHVSIRKRKEPWIGADFQLASTIDPSVQELASRFVPLCESAYVVAQFVELRSNSEAGVVSHALAGAMRPYLREHLTLVAQLEDKLLQSSLSLRDMWFFCQPVLRVVIVLASVANDAQNHNIYGSGLLNLLQEKVDVMGGDPTAKSLLETLQTAARIPYDSMLRKWLAEGIIDDPYGEFFIVKNKELQKEELSGDYEAAYWERRFTIRKEQPEYLRKHATVILTTGKYLDAVRECGKLARAPWTKNDDQICNESTILLQETIDIAHKFASQALFSVVFDQFDLRGRLESVKHYFLLDQGDLFVHFVDSAKEELQKWPALISLEKLQPLLELALRTSVCSADPYHRDLGCSVAAQPVSAVASAMQIRLREVVETSTDSTRQKNDTDLSGPKGPMNGWECFQFEYKVSWPLSIILSKLALAKYQLIFRHLFHCKYVEHRLCSAFQAHKVVRNIVWEDARLSASLCRSMLYFITRLLDYYTNEVLEPSWRVMDSRVQAARSVDEVAHHHHEFLSKCLRECTLLNTEIYNCLENLKQAALQYVASAQRLMVHVGDIQLEVLSRAPPLSSSIPHPQDAHNRLGDLSGDAVAQEHRRQLRQIRIELQRKVQEAADDAAFGTTLRRIQATYEAEMKKLMNSLKSQAAHHPCFANLLQHLQEASWDGGTCAYQN